MKLRIGLDLDDTLNEFMNPYLKDLDILSLMEK